jgi:hypothetical protein
MIINGAQVQSAEHLEELIIDMDEESKIGLRALYQEEQNLVG